MYFQLVVATVDLPRILGHEILSYINAKVPLVKHNSLDIFPAIKLILGWDVFFRSASTDFERRENVRSEFSSCFDVGVLGMHPRVEVAEGKRALRNKNLVQTTHQQLY